MRVFAVLVLALIASTLIQPSTAQEKIMLTTEDHKEIGAVLDRFREGWERRDMAILGSTMTPDCDWVNTVGMYWKGRETVVKAHRILLSTRFKDVTPTNGSHEETEIAPGVALVVATSSMNGFTTPDGQRIPPVENRGTAVMLKQNGHWLIRSFQNTPIDPMAAQHDPGK
jgi:uncharacterized protein (TIGR02246 family)